MVDFDPRDRDDDIGNIETPLIELTHVVEFDRDADDIRECDEDVRERDRDARERDHDPRDVLSTDSSCRAESNGNSCLMAIIATN